MQPVAFVHMGDQQPVDIARIQANGRKLFQQAGNGMVGAAIDEGATALFHDQVGGIEMLALERGVDGMDAVLAHAFPGSMADSGF